MWTEKTPAEILADLNPIINSVGVEPANTLVMPRDVWLHYTALSQFGERVNRANRRKFRRVKLRILQSM